jgi:cytoskeletal protein RodZ
MAVAERLRQARERRGLTLEQLADETRIPLDRLAAFEREGLRPDSGFYHRAWIRAYAHALGLDDRGFVAALEQDLAAAAPSAAEERSRQVREWPSLAALCSVVAAAFIVAALLFNREPRPESVPARSVSDAVAAVHEERPAPPPVPASLATVGTDEPAIAPPLPVVEPTSTVTQLVITSKPDGARVTVDGIGWGPTPVTIRHLTEGVKRIRVTHDGYAGSERLIEVRPERVNRISVQLRSLPRS